jgi:hypothetical protein
MTRRIPPSEKVNKLPKRYREDRRIASWDLDWGSALGNKVMGELLILAQDLGGWQSLSRQRQILVEKATFLYLMTTEYETALLAGKPPPFDAGTYSNKVNVLLGHLKTLGLERRAKPARSLREVMDGAATPLRPAQSLPPEPAVGAQPTDHTHNPETRS